MKACHDIQDLMQEILAGSAAEGERSRLEEHIASCDACRTEWTLLQQITAAPLSRPDPGEAFWDGFHDRLQERMHQEGRLEARTERPTPVMRLLPRRVMQIAAAIALVAVGILLGRSSLSGDVNAPGLTESQAELVALDAQAFSVLDRSRTLLLEVANFDADQDLPSDLNMDRRQEAASRLVRETADLRSRMSEADRQRMLNLLSDLEFILLQLAHLDAEVDLPQIEMMQQGIDRQAILFKIDIESMQRESMQREDVQRESMRKEDVQTNSPAANAAPQARRSAI